MAKTRRTYAPEFKAEAVQLVLQRGLTRRQVADDLGICRSVIAAWVRAAKEESAVASTSALPSDVAAELARLRKENAILEEEREILKKAAAFFAKETR